MVKNEVIHIQTDM